MPSLWEMWLTKVVSKRCPTADQTCEQAWSNNWSCETLECAWYIVCALCFASAWCGDWWALPHMARFCLRVFWVDKGITNTCYNTHVTVSLDCFRKQKEQRWVAYTCLHTRNGRVAFGITIYKFSYRVSGKPSRRIRSSKNRTEQKRAGQCWVPSSPAARSRDSQV